jgi:hypothetical protein
VAGGHHHDGESRGPARIHEYVALRRGHGTE